jgi:hypothetical protein
MISRVNAAVLADPYGNNTSNFMAPKGTVNATNKLVPKAPQYSNSPNKIIDDAIQRADSMKLKTPEWEKKEFNLGTSLASNPLAVANITSQGAELAKSFKGLSAAKGVMKDANKAFAEAAKVGGSDVAEDALKNAKDGLKGAKGALAGAGISLGATAGKMALGAMADKKLAVAGMDEKKYMKANFMKNVATDSAASNIVGTGLSMGLSGILTPAGAAAVGEGAKLLVNTGNALIKRKKLKSDFKKKVSDFKQSEADTIAYNKSLQDDILRERDRAKFQGLMNNSQMYNPGSGNPILIAKNGAKITLIPKFRRGGELDIQKENVILDGPSHDDHNNTGTKNDRGLAVVHKNAKIAEIESLELVLNKKASVKLENLVAEYKKTKNSKILDKIAEITSEEINENTYDYSKELLD